ncbi:MAG: FtsX-like permease family protein [Gammaproteobacteria bacterium]
MLWLRLAWKEISNNYKFSLFFVLNLGIGLIGFIALDSFKHSIDQHLANNSKAILTADVEISSRFPLTAKETGFAEAFLDTRFEATNQISFLSMVAANNNSRMSQLVAIEAGFPQYGDLGLQQRGSVLKTSARAELLSGDNIWVARDLMVLLGLQIGDQVKIGAREFTIIDVVLDDPTTSISAMNNFPAIYMGIAQIENTGLIQLGSRISYARFYKLPPAFELKGLREKFTKAAQIEFKEPRRVTLTTHLDQSADLGRILTYMNDYLGLIALIALFLAGVGAAYLFRSFFTSRFKDMAILMCLGGTPQQAYYMTLMQIVLLGTISAAAASLAAYFALPVLPSLFTSFLPRGFTNSMDVNSLILALFMGTLGSVICCLPILSKIYSLNPVGLFHEKVEPSAIGPHWLRNAASYAPILLVFWSLAIWQAHSTRIGTVFIAGFLIAIGLLAAIGWAILRVCGLLSGSVTVIRKLALRNLDRNRMGALSCFLAIGLGSLLINLIPQIQKGLQQEIASPARFTMPDFFMYDIQPEQIAPLQQLLKQQGYALAFQSPQVSARLDVINDKPFGEALETADEQRMQRRMYNLTYQDQLKASEAVQEGKAWDGAWQPDSTELPGISVEQNFAKRMGLKIGDTLTFDVQGVPVQGRIVNTRKVTWNSFQPNFMVSFQPGPLDPAPKTFVAAISKVAANERLHVQNSIVNAFPNISIINVQQIVGRVLDITDQISWAIKVMAWLAILAGLVVLFSIARYEVKSRFWEINLLKILGASFTDVKAIVQIEFGILGFCAAFTGTALSLAMSYSLAWFVFDRLWRFDALLTAGSLVAITALSMLTALIATLSVLRQKPLELLRAT